MLVLFSPSYQPNMNQIDPLYKYPNYSDVPKYTPLDISNQWDSLYIPYVRNDEINDIVYEIENRFAIGKVKHVDTKPRMKNGSKEQFSSLFVHFEYWFNSDFAIFLRYYLNKHGKYDISKYYLYYMTNNSPNGQSLRQGKKYDFHILINRSRARSNSDSEQFYTSYTKLSGNRYNKRKDAKNTNKSLPSSSVSSPSSQICYACSPPKRCICDEYETEETQPSKYSLDELGGQIDTHQRLFSLLFDEIAALRELVNKQMS